MGHPLLRRDAAALRALVRRGATVLLLAALVVASAPRATARPLDDVIGSGTLTVFVYSDYAPYSWETEEGPRGIDVDIAHALGEALGVETELLIRGADENVDDDLRVNVWKGDLIHRRVADVMLHVPYDRELDVRNELAVLAAPYFQEEMALLHDAERLPEVESFGRFVATPIAVELDTAGDFFLSNAFGGRLAASVRRARTFVRAADLYLGGEVPALLATRAQAEWLAMRAREERGIGSAVSAPPMPGIVRGGWPVGIAVREDSRDLGYALGDALAALIESGEMEAICARYGVTWVAPVMP